VDDGGDWCGSVDWRRVVGTTGQWSAGVGRAGWRSRRAIGESQPVRAVGLPYWGVHRVILRKSPGDAAYKKVGVILGA